jgi:hypothetical protein
LRVTQSPEALTVPPVQVWYVLGVPCVHVSAVQATPDELELTLELVDAGVPPVPPVPAPPMPPPPLPEPPVEELELAVLPPAPELEVLVEVEAPELDVAFGPELVELPDELDPLEVELVVVVVLLLLPHPITTPWSAMVEIAKANVARTFIRPSLCVEPSSAMHLIGRRAGLSPRR